MSTVTRTRRRVKPSRSIRWLSRPEGSIPGLVTITSGKDRDTYSLQPILADFGHGFELAKVNADPAAEVYHVNLDGLESSCDCKGFLRHSHCKHVEGLLALLARQRSA
jgi:hypothetical protein